jgi:DNA-binding response OmpR family regulator
MLPDPRFVLVVDGDLVLGRALATRLGAVGFRARAVLRGGDALALAREVLPDFVVCDPSLPDMSGAELALALRAVGGTRPPYLVAHSATLEGLVEAGVYDAVVVRPASLEAVLREIARLEQRATSSRSGVRARVERTETRRRKLA